MTKLSVQESRRAKLSLQEFREDYGGDSDDANLALDIVQRLNDAVAPGLVSSARAFLEALRVYQAALVDAGLRSD